MRRILIIIGAVVAALVLTTVFGVALLVNTGAGRSFIVSQAEPRIAAVLGGDADIGKLTGGPPGRIVLHDVILSGAEGPWLTIKRAELRWRPLALFRRDINVDLIAVEGARLLREPPDRDGKDDEPKPLKLELPNNLPSIRIAEISIDDFRSDLGAVQTRLDGGGSVAIGGQRIDANLNLTSSDDKDTISVRISLDPRSDRALADVTVASAADGVIATLAGAGGPIFVEAKGDAPIADANIAINGTVGDYGAFNGAVTGDLRQMNALGVALDFTPGVALAEIKELGANVRLEAQIEQNTKGGALTIVELTAGAGAVEGAAEWQSDKRGVATLTANLNVSFADEYQPAAQNVVGDKLNLVANLTRLPQNYGLDATMTGNGVTATIEDGVTDLAKKITGNITAKLDARDDATAPLNLGARASGAIDVDFDQSVKVSGLNLRIGETSTLNGTGIYNLGNKTIAFSGDIDLAPALIRELAPSIEASGAVNGAVDIEGSVDQFTLKADLETPDAIMGNNNAPALAIKAEIAGLPTLPTGDVSAHSLSGATGSLNAQLRSSRDGRIAIPLLDYVGPNFKLAGSGAFQPDLQNISLDLTYTGETGAQPWPGLELAGSFAVKGRLARQDLPSDLTLTANGLRANGVAIENLKAMAKGPPRAIALTINADRIGLESGRSITELQTAAIVNAKENPRATLQSFDAIVDTINARLTGPANFTFKDGIGVEDLRLAWGRSGTIAVDGAFSSKRWRAAAQLNEVNIPDTDGRLTLRLDLDTNNDTPATGKFQMRSLLTEAPDASLSGAFLWDGKTLNLTSKKDEDAIDMDIRLPAVLTRAPSIAIKFDGPLDGAARYDGDVDVIAAYLPPALQSLEGALVATINLAGTTDAPQITGQAAITDGDYTEPQSGFSLSGLHTEANANVAPGGSAINFSGGARGADQSGADTISLSGGIQLGETSTIDLKVTLNNAEFSAHPITGARASGQVDIKGPLDRITVTGDIRIDELNAEIIAPETTGLVPINVVNAEDGPAVLNPNGETTTVSFDYAIKVSADDRVFIRGRGLESEWSADLKAVSERGGPLILGSGRLRRGWLDFSGRRFDLTRGRITFDRLSKNDPLLDIRAEYQTSDGVTAIISVSGRAKEPSIELLSTPSLPSEDVMALVLFGKPADELTAVESLQAAQALASLGGVGPFGGGGITGSLRDAVGLDLLNFDVDPEQGGGSLTVGKYVADGFFVSATQNARGQDGAVRIEYELTDNISVETEIKQDGDQTVSANWKRDF